MSRERGAVISGCGRYRYSLWREVSAEREPRKIALFCGLNPSTADAYVDDNTIRKEIFFTRAFGCDLLMKVNLFAYRATDPKDLVKATEPFGPENEEAWLLAIRDCKASDGVVIAAWGAHKMARSAASRSERSASDRFVAFVRNAGLPIRCFGTTASGAPKHPLYLPNATALVPFAEPA